MEPLSQPDIPDPELDRAFMGEALRQAVKASISAWAVASLSSST